MGVEGLIPPKTLAPSLRLGESEIGSAMGVLGAENPCLCAPIPSRALSLPCIISSPPLSCLTSPPPQIPRYILTLHELLAHTPHEHVERNSLDYAKSKLEELSR